jgi:hypothetical protein
MAAASSSNAKPGTGARFDALRQALGERKGVRDPGALAASIGRKKFGNARMTAMAAAGRKKAAS